MKMKIFVVVAVAMFAACGDDIQTGADADMIDAVVHDAMEDASTNEAFDGLYSLSWSCVESCWHDGSPFTLQDRLEVNGTTVLYYRSSCGPQCGYDGTQSIDVDDCLQLDMNSPLDQFMYERHSVCLGADIEVCVRWTGFPGPGSTPREWCATGDRI